MPDTGFSGTASANPRSAGTASANTPLAGTASSGAGARLDGTISASGRKITFVANHPGMSPRGRSVGGADIRWIAQEIADVGVSVTVRGPDRAIGRLDDVDVPVAQRVLTGSPHIRLGSPASPLPDARMPRRSHFPGRCRFPRPHGEPAHSTHSTHRYHHAPFVGVLATTADRRDRF